MVNPGLDYPLIPRPPKYFEDFNETRFDPLRHQKWFRKLIRHWYMARGAELAYKDMVANGWSLNLAAKTYKIDKKRIRHYGRFISGFQLAKRDPRYPIYQKVLDEVYEAYCRNRGVINFHMIAKPLCKLYGISRSTFYEFWEFDPNFLPTVLKTDDMAQGA